MAAWRFPFLLWWHFLRRFALFFCWEKFWEGRLLLNGIIGGVVLYLVNLFGGLIGLHAALNPFTALIAGTLGIPGVALVLVLPLLLTL